MSTVLQRCLLAAVGVLATVGGPASAAGRASIDIDDLRPYLARGPGKRGRIALHLGEAKRAVRMLRLHLRRRRARQRAQARYLLAHALLRSGDHPAAARLFRRLLGSYRRLAPYHRYYGARALYRAHRFAEAEKLVAAVGRDSVLRWDAALLRADALQALHQEKRAADIWRTYAKARPGGKRIAEAHFRIAEAWRRRARAVRGEARLELRRRAVAHYKRILAAAPLSRWSGDAAHRLSNLAAILPQGQELVRLSQAQLYRQAMVYYRKMRNVEAERRLGRLLGSSGLTPALKCKAQYHRAKSVFKQRQRARAAPMFERAAQLCAAAGEDLFVLKSRYNLARGRMRQKRYEQAAKQFLAIERDYAKHSYADDARLHAAEAFAALDRWSEVEKLLSTLPERHPGGDMEREALWRLARRAYLEGEDKKALRYLDRIIDKLGRAHAYYAEGRALYWKARLMQRRGKRATARRLHEQAIREYPLSYYALLSFNRLRDEHRAAYRRLRRELLAAVGNKPGRWTFDLGPLARDSSFLRGVELARLGFGGAAVRELRRAGISTRRGKPKKLWLAAVLLDRAGLWNLSHSVPRSRLHEHERSYPLGANVRPWRIAYPRAFPHMVRRHSRKLGVTRYLVWSIMREESGFNPRIESYANAVGLMQLIVPTARAAAERTKRGNRRAAIDRKALRDPATNIRLGAANLRFLQRGFGKIYPLIIAGYNAGHGAVCRWLSKMGGATSKLDEFIERIPYDQTRRYTKRVLASLFAYQALYERGRPIPRIGQKVPRLSLAGFRRRVRNAKAR